MPADDSFDRVCGIVEQPSGSSPYHGRAVVRLSVNAGEKLHRRAGVKMHHG